MPIHPHFAQLKVEPVPPRTSTPNPVQTPIPSPTLSNLAPQPRQTPQPTQNQFNQSQRGENSSRCSHGSLNSSVYQAKIESLQDQVQILLNQSAEKEDKLHRMESELEETKRQMKELMTLYQEDRVRKTIQNNIPPSRRHQEETHFEEVRESLPTPLHKPVPVKPNPPVFPSPLPPGSIPPPFIPVRPQASQKPPTPFLPQPSSIPLEPKVFVQNQAAPTNFPPTPTPPQPPKPAPPPPAGRENTGLRQNKSSAFSWCPKRASGNRG